MQFKQIVAVDLVNITDQSRKELQQYSQKKLSFPDSPPADETELLKRIGPADAILVNYSTTLSASVIQQTRNLKYIGICGTNLRNIDLEAARLKGITVTNVEDYGDEATAEYIFYQLLKLLRGEEGHSWQGRPTELFEKTIGIVGMGAVGREMLRLAKGFGMNILYSSRTRRPELENQQVRFVKLPQLLARSDIITLHVPKGLKILDAESFQQIRAGTILVNSCLGQVFDLDDFLPWIRKGQNFAIFDRSTDPVYQDKLKDIPNVILAGSIAGLTLESKQRLATKVLNNIKKYLQREERHHVSR